MKAIWDWDQAVFKAINRGWHSDSATLFWNAVTWSGLGTIQGLLLLLLAIHRPWRVPALLAGLSGIIAGILRYPIALWVGRPRPSSGDLFPFALIIEPTQNMRSFPSGHTTGAFAIAWFAAYLSWRAGKPGLGLAALFWALLVGISRIYMGVHWPTDIIGGAGMGLVGAGITIWWSERAGWLPAQNEGGEPQGARP